MKALRPLALLLSLCVVGAGAWLTAMLGQPYQGFGREGVFIDVARGASVRSIAGLLAGRGVVRSALAFELLCRWRRHTLQAGEYFFDRPRAATEIFAMLASGRVYVRPITVPEGLTVRQIADLVEREGLTSRDSFLAAAEDTTLIRDLAPHARSLEGFLFPATYQFPRHVSGHDIAAAMVRRFREAWNSLPQRDRRPQGLSATEVLTLASLVERETPAPEERPMIAGVFYNRLRRGMPLECDPTVIYALERADKYRGLLSRRDLRFESPYNTYLRRGLPPGPIANPGEASLRAALDPPQVDYLYFVSNAQGRHFFSRTLAEHNANVARYRHMAAQGGRLPTDPEKPAERRPGKPTRTESWR